MAEHICRGIEDGCHGCDYCEPSDLTCPFCKEDNFDPIGLKAHLMDGDCKEFNETENL